MPPETDDRPKPILVGPEELHHELETGRKLLLIDLRPAEDFAQEHLRDAVHLDLFGISAIDTDPAPLRSFFWIIEHLFASRGVTSEIPIVPTRGPVVSRP